MVMSECKPVGLSGSSLPTSTAVLPGHIPPKAKDGAGAQAPGSDDGEEAEAEAEAEKEEACCWFSGQPGAGVLSLVVFWLGMCRGNVLRRDACQLFRRSTRRGELHRWCPIIWRRSESAPCERCSPAIRASYPPQSKRGLRRIVMRLPAAISPVRSKERDTCLHFALHVPPHIKQKRSYRQGSIAAKKKQMRAEKEELLQELVNGA